MWLFITFEILSPLNSWLFMQPCESDIHGVGLSTKANVRVICEIYIDSNPTENHLKRYSLYISKYIESQNIKVCKFKSLWSLVF